MSLEDMVKRYVITTAQFCAKPNREFLASLDTYCKVNKASLYILPTAGMDSKEVTLHPELQKYAVLTKDKSLCENLKISTFWIKPTQINPLTGIRRFAPGDKSFIFASPKQFVDYVPVDTGTIPKAVMTTGAITEPHYPSDTRAGIIAARDHEYGAVVVEMQDAKTFHFRHISPDKHGAFYDITGHYAGKKHTARVECEALVLGDIHPYETDPTHHKLSMEQIRHFKPKRLFLHDVFNARSISHHYKDHNIQKHKVYKEQGLNLSEELRHTAKYLKEVTGVMKYGQIYVVASNHDEHLYRYLDEGRFIGDKGNDEVASVLYTAALRGRCPLREGIGLYTDIDPRVTFLSRDEGVVVKGVQCGHHGDLGANGAKGSTRALEEANGKSISGHTHTASKFRHVYRVGTSTRLRLDYNRGYSSWTQTNAVLYGSGAVQLLNTIGGKWHG
jgi:RPA family protein